MRIGCSQDKTKATAHHLHLHRQTMVFVAFSNIYRPALKKFYHWMEGLHFKLLMRKISRRFCFILIFILKRNVWRGLIWLNFVKEKKKALSAIAHRLLLLILFQAFFPHFVLFFRHKFAILYTIMTCGLLICALY